MQQATLTGEVAQQALTIGESPKISTILWIVPIGCLRPWSRYLVLVVWEVIFLEVEWADSLLRKTIWQAKKSAPV